MVSGPCLILGSLVLYGWNLLVGYYIPFPIAEIRKLGPIWLSWLDCVIHIKIQQFPASVQYSTVQNSILQSRSASLIVGAIAIA